MAAFAALGEGARLFVGDSAVDSPSNSEVWIARVFPLAGHPRYRRVNRLRRDATGNVIDTERRDPEPLKPGGRQYIVYREKIAGRYVMRRPAPRLAP